MAEETLFQEDHDGELTPEQQELTRIRELYRARLAEKLKDPEFRKVAGFPVGTDQAILALSDPPYYTACPNPFIEEWLQANAKAYNASTDSYHREPFAADVSEGKNDPIYNAHSYHTKVPHKAIMRYILHYTEPGDVVYDGFCGTGMTGVAAQMCGNKAQVESLDYKVQPDGTIRDENGKSFSKYGARNAILNDLSPAATFIAHNYNTPVDAAIFEREAKRVLKQVEQEYGWMYSTLHGSTPEETERIANAVRCCKTADELRAIYRDLQSPRSSMRASNSVLQIGRINFSIFTDVFICPNCGAEMVYWDIAVDQNAGSVRDTFFCTTCRAETNKRECEHAVVTRYDYDAQHNITQSKQTSVIINYSIGNKRHEKRADAYDLELVRFIDNLKSDYWYPAEPMMGKGERWGDSWRAGYHKGITHTHHFFTRRNINTLAVIWHFLREAGNVSGFLFTSTLPWTTRQNRLLLSNYFQKRGGVIGQTLAGTLYLSSISVETNPIYRFELRGASAGFTASGGKVIVACQSATDFEAIQDNSLDYIFTDPPFGGNIMYSELNFLWEAWLGVKTNIIPEAITNATQMKKLEQYQNLMTLSFAQYYRALKPGRWMTVEFHNSANSVWNCIQEGLERVGFVVADVRVLTKEHNTFKQVNSAAAVKSDLVISCYKPHHDFEERFRELQGKPEGVIEFLREHLAMLPVATVNNSGKLETVAERTRYLLFDRMVAYHLQRGARIPLTAADFYHLLDDQFIGRDEMYFLSDQAARYDAVKAQGVETEQLSIFVRDEKTAVQWVRSRLTEQPQTLGDLTPKFMQELREWESHEPRPELRDLLREYFIEGADIWRVPDPNNEKDLEVLRHNAHLKLFRDYANTKGPLKVFRKEAVLEGFRHCWDTKQYGIITAICEKIPPKVLQETHEFVQFYDIAKDLAPETSEQMTFSWE